MAKECEIKSYIKDLNISERARNFLNNTHNDVFNKLKDSKSFRYKDGYLFTKKNDYNSSLVAVNNINREYGEKVASIVKYAKSPNQSIVKINTSLMLKHFEEDVRGVDFFKNDWKLYEQEQKEDIVSDNSVQYQLPQGRELNEYVASEKTIRDLAERMSDRIGIPVKFESDRTKQYKGKLENNTAVINLAYADLTSPIHEILGHPIIRAIKYSINIGGTITLKGLDTSTRKQELSKLYQNLLKELEYGTGKEVLDMIKRDYIYKTGPQAPLTDLPNVEKVRHRYTLEEQQEEAIVELLGMYTADRLNKVRDGKLISLLKRLLKEMKAFMRSLFNQKEVDIDSLPDNMTLGDLSDLLAYSNSKLILPGNEVVYTTPDNQQFKTYVEASKHLSELSKLSEVDLEGVKINTDKNSIPYNNVESIISFLENNSDYGKIFFGVEYLEDSKSFVHNRNGKRRDSIPSNEEIIESFKKDYQIREIDTKSINNFIEKNKEYEQSKEIIEEWKKVNDIKYDPEEVYSRGQGFYSAFAAYSDLDLDTLMANILHHIEDNEKAGGKFALSAFTKPIDKTIRHIEKSGLNFVIFPKPEHIMWAANTDVFSGSVWDASEKVSKGKQSELLGVSYTKYPSLQNINTIQPNLASIIDDLAHHHNELGIQLTGNNFRLEINKEVLNETDGKEYYKIKAWVDKINSILDQKYGKLVKPEISKKTTKLKEVYELQWNNGSVIGRFDSLEEAKKEQFGEYTDSVGNKISAEEATKIVQQSIDIIGKQPTQTKENLKESIGEVQKRVESNNYNKFGGVEADEGMEFINPQKYNKKEYTSQAEINLKVAALKEGIRKYPRSLIRSEVRSLTNNWGGRKDLWESDELPFQKIPSVNIQDSQGNQYTVQESDIITYPTDFGDLNYIKNSEGDLVMVNRNIQENFVSLQEFPLNLPQNTKDMYMFTKECF